jgi:hypothetical protein
MLTRPTRKGVRAISACSIPRALGSIGSIGRLTSIIRTLGRVGSIGRLNCILRTLGSIGRLKSPRSELGDGDSEQAARSPMKRTAEEVPARNAVVVVVKPAAAVAAIKLAGADASASA